MCFWKIDVTFCAAEEQREKSMLYQWKNYFLSVTNDIAPNPYVNEPGFTHAYFPSQSNYESSFTRRNIAKKLALK